jgi:hypothetical protein
MSRKKGCGVVSLPRVVRMSAAIGATSATALDDGRRSST